MTPAELALRNPVGTHVTTGKGLASGAFANAVELGCESVQVFVGNPRGWALSEGNPAQDARFRELTRDAGMRVFIHTPYLVNLGSPTPATYERSVATLAHNLRRAIEIGAEGVVVHTGSAVIPASASDDAGDDAGDDAVRAALTRVREGLMPVLETLDDDSPWLLLEPTAGQGRSLCAGVEDLPAYLAALEHHPRVGICLDTCHVFAAGEPLDEPGGATACVDAVVAAAGPGALRLIHANDSMDVRGAHLDRHQKIGQGHIGTDAFVELLAHPATAGVPVIAETPGSRDVGDPDLPLLKDLRAAAAAHRESAAAAARREGS